MCIFKHCDPAPDAPRYKISLSHGNIGVRVCENHKEAALKPYWGKDMHISEWSSHFKDNLKTLKWDGKEWKWID